MPSFISFQIMAKNNPITAVDIIMMHPTVTGIAWLSGIAVGMSGMPLESGMAVGDGVETEDGSAHPHAPLPRA